MVVDIRRRDIKSKEIFLFFFWLPIQYTRPIEYYDFRGQLYQYVHKKASIYYMKKLKKKFVNILEKS